MAIQVHVNWDDAIADRRDDSLTERVERAARAALTAQQLASAEVSITLMGDASITELNRQYLSRDNPTDVIAFPLYAEGENPLGDVYIGYEQALRQAETLGVTPTEELARLAIHGTLHVLGYDHPEGPEREQSELWDLQERILREVDGA